MTLPLNYSLQSLRHRWAAGAMTVFGVAASVVVLLSTLALASGFRATLVSSGSPGNALIRRAGATADMDSMLPLQEARAVEDAPEVARDGAGPISSAESVVLAPLPRLGGEGDANVRLRGITPRAFDVHADVRIVRGRRPARGRAELAVGKHATASYRGLGLGESVTVAGTRWTVVGIFDSGGSAFDSEAWADSDLVRPSFRIPLDVVQVVAVRLVSPEALEELRRRLHADPRLQVQVDRETEYYANASQTMTTLILGLGALVTALMGTGAVLAGLNTTYSALAERTREVATLRALGFGRGAVVLSLLAESSVTALAGGLIGCLAATLLDGVSTSTLNLQTFSHLAFAFRVTPALLGVGLAFAVLLGTVGGLPPALHAVRLSVAAALRD